MADGKIFAAEFALRRNVKALDKILIEDSDDGVVKYAFPPQIAALSGYAYADSIADLPEDPVNKTIGYVVGDKFYIYVGEGGNAKDGLYQEVQGFVGPQGIPGPKGDKGDAGDGAIDEAYLANYLQQNQYQTASDVNSALAIYATQAYVTQEIDKLLGGASGAYDTLKEIEEVLKGNVDSIGDLFEVLDTKWTQDNTLIAHWNEAYSWGDHATAGYVAKTYVDSNFVTLATAQTITGEKNFTGGFKVNGGVLEYNASLGTWVLNGDLLVTGGVSAFSNIEGFTPSTITDAVLIDNETIKRNSVGALYVASGSDDGGIDEAYLAEYLTANNYAKKSDINSALTDYATQSWVTGKGYITGITSLMVTNALGYTPLSTDGGTITGNFYIKKPSNATIIFQPSNAAKSFWFGVNTSEEWFCTNGGYTETYKLLHSDNYSNYALPKDGTAVAASKLATTRSIFGQNFDGSTDVSGNIFPINASGCYYNETGISYHTNKQYQTSILRVTSSYNVAIGGTTASEKLHVYGNIKAEGSLTCRDNFRTNDNYYGFSVKSQGSEDNWYGVKTYMQFDEGATMGVCRIGTAFRHQGLAIGFSTGNDYNYNIPSDCDYTDVVGIRKDGNVAIGGAITSEKLHVYGNILATGGVTATNSSDKRLKKNIRKFNASKVLMSLGGVYEYEYVDSEVQKNHIYEGTHYGLIYQNVKGTTLDVMCHEREDGFGALNYIHPKFISLIAGATMENISEVKKLKRKIRTLENKVKQLEGRA